ncbi:hypothetical protein [Streptomyces sp. NBC_00459]|uniref:hypothetical protein n=1 Tax=Streptomyces sp. NBC_00459 TaxID=2975749 RepID=UPI002E17BC86
MDGHNADGRLGEPAKASPDFWRLYGYLAVLAVYGAQGGTHALAGLNAAYAGGGQFGEVLGRGVGHPDRCTR